MDEEKLNMIAAIAKKKFVLLEYGLESVHDTTLDRINRGHHFDRSAKAIEMAAGKNIHLGVHLIFGLPGETREMMLESVKTISGLPVNSEIGRAHV